MVAITVLFLSLGLDTLAVSVGLGLSGLARNRWWRVGLTFAFFEGLMPIGGLVVGARLGHAVGIWADYGAAALLILVGVLAIREALADDDDDVKAPSVEGRQLLLTALSVSLDELAVGFSLGVLHVPVGPALAYITVQALAVTFLGLSFGRRIGARLGERAELVSGVVLTLLGVILAVNAATGAHLL